jgi:hypothetical protein
VVLTTPPPKVFLITKPDVKERRMEGETIHKNCRATEEEGNNNSNNKNIVNNNCNSKSK